nr:MAG TPA: hypothetical protein [Caudoviricetes sp.]
MVSYFVEINIKMFYYYHGIKVGAEIWIMILLNRN